MIITRCDPPRPKRRSRLPNELGVVNNKAHDATERLLWTYGVH